MSGKGYTVKWQTIKQGWWSDADIKDMLASRRLKGWLTLVPGPYSPSELIHLIDEMYRDYPDLLIKASTDEGFGDDVAFCVSRPITTGELEILVQTLEDRVRDEREADQEQYERLRKKHPDWFTDGGKA